MGNNRSKIIVVDDDSDILEFISYNLINSGFQVFTASDGSKAIELAKIHNPDLIILDVMMPEMDGMEVCRRLRELTAFKDTLIMFLSARSEDYSQIAGFNVGADDYITKPIRPRVLLARINALLSRRHNRDGHKDLITIGDIEINLSERTVKINNELIILPKKEFDLLCLLSSQPGRIFTRNEIYQKIWGSTVQVGERTLDVHIRKIRKKIGEKHIKTSKGTGYGLVC